MPDKPPVIEDVTLTDCNWKPIDQKWLLYARREAVLIRTIRKQSTGSRVIPYRVVSIDMPSGL
ncbi:MAG TPA: hypothetical protein PKK43_02595 [Spirochaetota bacterium]|nr:hypothetical protein [Spirochaetota bacterium]